MLVVAAGLSTVDSSVTVSMAVVIEPTGYGPNPEPANWMLSVMPRGSTKATRRSKATGSTMPTVSAGGEDVIGGHRNSVGQTDRVGDGDAFADG